MALSAVFATFAMGLTYTGAAAAVKQNNGPYVYNNGDSYYAKSAANIAARVFGILAMIPAGPLFFAIMMICCVHVGRERKRIIFKVIRIFSFLDAVLLLLTLVRK